MCDSVQRLSRWRMRSKSITDRFAASPKKCRDQIIQLQQVRSDTRPTDQHCRSADLSLSSPKAAINSPQMHRKYKIGVFINNYLYFFLIFIS